MVKSFPLFQPILDRKLIRLWETQDKCLLIGNLLHISVKMHFNQSTETLWEYWINGLLNLQIADILSHCIQISSPISDQYKKFDQSFICYVETFTDVPQYFHLCIVLTLWGEVSIGGADTSPTSLLVHFVDLHCCPNNRTGTQRNSRAERE
jgi:hypothetical protein